MRLPRYLGTAFDQLRGRGDDKRRETTCCTREPYFCKPVGAIVGIRRMRQVGESAVVGYEKKGIQSAVGENRCCCAYPRSRVRFGTIYRKRTCLGRAHLVPMYQRCRIVLEARQVLW